MLVIRLYKCTGKGVSRNRWFSMVGKEKNKFARSRNIVDTKYEKMYRIAFNYTHSKEDALDVIQKALKRH